MQDRVLDTAYREALAGSYNLAAVHVLERTSVAQLHQRLRRFAETRRPPVGAERQPQPGERLRSRRRRALGFQNRPPTPSSVR